MQELLPLRTFRLGYDLSYRAIYTATDILAKHNAK
jgi:hypothetical protein